MIHAYRRQLPLLLLPAAADAARHSPLGTLVLISTCINTLFWHNLAPTVPGDIITVAISKDTKKGVGSGKALSLAVSTSPVAADGYWRVCLTDPIAPTLGNNHTVRFGGAPSGSSAVNEGVLIGNVILCSG